MSANESFRPIVCVVGFHHARGPDVETWIGVADEKDPATENDWSLLPFLALSDGAHSSLEDFSYFTLRKAAVDGQAATSLFGIACTRQLDASTLINRPADVTRSTVQKAVVVICDSPHHFGALREKLSMVTKAWFAQRDFLDIVILEDFQESLAKTFRDREDERDQFFGLSLREMVHEFKHQTLVLFKCLLLQPKMLFFGSNCERLCMMQFSLISLIPGLIRKLQDSADPQFNNLEKDMVMPTSLKTSERSSLLTYVGLPLHVFGKGSLFGPYTPLQQLDMLADRDTKSYVVGSTNSLLLAQKDIYSDILINLDDDQITISNPTLRQALTLTTPDRRWIDFLTQTVNDTWDEANPGRPRTLGYAGSEEFIRLQFEEYLLALLSAVKFRAFTQTKGGLEGSPVILDVEGDPAAEFGSDWIRAWMQTENYRIFNTYTDSHIFDIVEPNHPCTGGLTIEDVQRRLAQQVSDLHLDERLQTSKEVLGKTIASGQKKVSTAFGNLWADIEVMREAQREAARKREAEQKLNGVSSGPLSPNENLAAASKFPRAPDMTQAQATVQAASQKAGAYLSSWGAWASEKRRTGWGRSPSGSASGSSPASPTFDNKESARPPTSSPQVLFQAQPDSPKKTVVPKQLTPEQGWSSQAVSGAEPRIQAQAQEAAVHQAVATQSDKALEANKEKLFEAPQVVMYNADSSRKNKDADDDNKLDDIPL